MEVLFVQERTAASDASVFKSPARWLRHQKLSREFWTFFWAAFFFDFGFAVYFFLFNLYLLDLHFNERSIGLVAGALTLGSVVGTLPAGVAARRFGIGRLLVVCFIAAPVFGVLRSMPFGESAQIILGFLSGLAMCLWGVCFLPALARSTTEQNRAAGFSLIFSVSIGTSTLGGLVCGYLPTWLKMAGHPMEGAAIKRLILIAACGIATVGLVSVFKMISSGKQDSGDASGEMQTADNASSRKWRLNPFLVRFLPAMALWTAVLAAFTPFANVYLSRNLQIPISQIGVIFSIAQVIQLLMGLLTPWVFRKLGLINGIVATQVSTAVALLCLAATHNARVAIVIYLGFSAMQWMSSPGLYNLLMTETPDQDRSMASSMTMFCNAVLGSAATAAAGAFFVQYGYPFVLVGVAALAFIAAATFRFFVGGQQKIALVAYVSTASNALSYPGKSGDSGEQP